MALSDVIGPVVAIADILKHRQHDCGLDIYLMFHLSDNSWGEMTSPVYTFRNLQGCKLQGCVRKLEMELLELGLIISVNTFSEIEFTQPLTFTWKVSAFNQTTDATRELSETLEFSARLETGSQFINVPVDKVKDLINENSLLFQWHIELRERLQTSAVCEAFKFEPAPHVAPHVVCDYHAKENIMEHHVKRIMTTAEKNSIFLRSKQSDGALLDLRDKVLMYKHKMSRNQEVFHTLGNTINVMSDRLSKLHDRYNEQQQNLTELGELWETGKLPRRSATKQDGHSKTECLQEVTFTERDSNPKWSSSQQEGFHDVQAAAYGSHFTKYARSVMKYEKPVVEKIHEMRALEVHLSRENKELSIFPELVSTTLSQNVHARYYDETGLSITLVKYGGLTSFQEMRDAIDQALTDSNRVLANIKFLFHKVLPFFYETKNIFGIIHVATCAHLELQAHALDRLERLILAKDALQITTIKYLKKSQYILAESICENSSSSRTLSHPGLEVILQRKCGVLFLLQGLMIMECAEPDYSGLEKFNTKLKRMIATKYQASSSEDKHVTSLTTFLEVSLKDTHWLVKYFLEPQKEPPRKVSEPVQFYVIAQLIKKMFESDDISSLETLKAYFCINPLSVSAAPVCIPLIMRGLTQLLNLASGTQACVDIYPDVLQMITACKVKDPGAFEDLRPVFQSLMLSQDPTVRKVIVDWLKSCDVSEQSSIRHLMKAVATLLSPVLVIKHDEKMDRSSHGDFDGWYSIPGTFNGHPASLLMRPSTLEEILSSRPRHFDDVGDELSLNHVNILRHLRHENIITLFAYNTRHIPIFYVMEDSTNLQEYLRQRKAKRTYCSDATLVKYLSQAAAALQYCHCRNVVLRDITAASFVVTGSDTIKLASFHLAFTLAENETERIIGFKESIMISSRRWPPESMRRNTWSKMSDIWMFGQLIYNVFTDVDVSDSEIGLERDEPNIRLQSDRCIDNIAIETIVSACAHLDPNQRANISNTINSLDLLIHKVTESPGRSATGSSLTNKTYNPKIDTTIKKLWDTGEDLSELRLIERALGSELGLNDYELEKMDVGYRRAHSSTRPSKADDRHLDMLLINPSDSESDYYSGNDSDD